MVEAGRWVLGFGYRVSGFEFRVSDFEFRVSGLGFRISGFGGTNSNKTVALFAFTIASTFTALPRHLVLMMAWIRQYLL